MVPGCRVRIVASGLRDEADHDDLRPWAGIPFDACVVAVERDGRAPLDACPSRPAIAAIDDLAGRLLDDLRRGWTTA